MSAVWHTRADLDAVYGAARIDDLTNVEGAAPADVLGQAMEDAEDEIRTALLERYRPEQLPAAGAAPRAVVRLAVDLAFANLHKRHAVVPDAVKDVRDRAERQLRQLVASGSLGLAGAPAVDSVRPVVAHTPSRPDRITLANLDDF